jgi:hypothetical protein
MNDMWVEAYVQEENLEYVERYILHIHSTNLRTLTPLMIVYLKLMIHEMFSHLM